MKYYLNGLQVTLLVSIMSVLLGTVIGLMAAMIKLNADRKKKETVLSRIIHIYVDVIRGTPSVLQLMIVYFAVFIAGWVCGSSCELRGLTVVPTCLR